MSENSTINPNPETILTNSLPPLLESRVCEAERMLQCLEVSTPRRSVGPEDMEWEGILAGPVEVIPSGREEEEVLVFDLPCAIIEGERGGEERLIGKQKCEGDRIVELEHEIERVRGLHREEVQKKTQHIQAVEEQLKQTKELLAMKSAELSGAHAFLSTTDRLSEVEVLGIIRDLNENIYQVAVNLTDEWEKLEPSRATSRMDVDPTSRPHVPALVQRVLSRDPVGLTFLLQSCLCSQVVKITSSWGHHRRLAILESVYKRLFASEGQAISARWRSLTYKHLSHPPPHSALLVEELTNVLCDTGSFSSTQQSCELVQTVALEGLETIIRLALRLERAFKVEIASSDMALLFESPGTLFDDARMIDEFGSDGTSIPGKQYRIAGTTEVGFGKRVSTGTGKGCHTRVLLRTKVVLEKDVVGS